MTPRLEALIDGMPGIFMQCQYSMATHKKNIIHLAKIHAGSSDVWEEVPHGIKLTGEKAFNDQFLNMVNRILSIKKGIPNADRIVKFIGAFIMHISQKGLLLAVLMCLLSNVLARSCSRERARNGKES